MEERITIVITIRREDTTEEKILADKLFEFAVENEVSMSQIKMAADYTIQKSLIVTALSKYGTMNYDKAAEHIMEMITFLQLKYHRFNHPSAGNIIDGFIKSLKEFENVYGISADYLEAVILLMDAEFVRMYLLDSSSCTADFTYALYEAYNRYCKNAYRYGGKR